MWLRIIVPANHCRVASSITADVDRCWRWCIWCAWYLSVKFTPDQFLRVQSSELLQPQIIHTFEIRQHYSNGAQPIFRFHFSLKYASGYHHQWQIPNTYEFWIRRMAKGKRMFLSQAMYLVPSRLIVRIAACQHSTNYYILISASILWYTQHMYTPNPVHTQTAKSLILLLYKYSIFKFNHPFSILCLQCNREFERRFFARVVRSFWCGTKILRTL